MLNRILLASTLFSLALLCPESIAADASTSATQVRPTAVPFEVTGEIVDSWCYAAKNVGIGRGPEHLKCASACIHGGVAIGIVDDKGNFYICAKHKAYQGPQLLLEPYVAKRVHIKGWLAKTGGCQLLKVDEVAEVGVKPVKPRVPKNVSQKNPQAAENVKKLLKMAEQSKTNFARTASPKQQ